MTLEAGSPGPGTQRGVDCHVAALARNRHATQLRLHVPVRSSEREPQLRLGALTGLSPLTQLTSLVVTRNPVLTSTPHVLTAEDVDAIAQLTR